MKIELDLKLLEEIKLDANEYVALYLIWRKGYGYFKPINLNPDWEKLQQDGWVVIAPFGSIYTYNVTEKFTDLFDCNFDHMFAELVATYPMKVASPTRGVRILHAKDPGSKSNLKAKNKYRKIVNNKKHKHKEIMLLLQKQLLVDQENLGYLQNLETWINNHTWEKYEEIDINDAKGTTKQRNTRLL
tara:strand:+ start:67 stop:627 length:561 start_codon:yes stop_codon:yes gene_type:complete